MGPEFARLGLHRGRLHRARVILYFVGSTIIAATLVAALILVYSRDAAVAKNQPHLDRFESEQMSFGTVLLVVPETTVPQGTRLSQVKLKTKAWPRTEVPMGAVLHDEDVEEVKQHYAKVALAAEQPIVKANLSTTPVLGGIAELVPPGHRAITIEVDATSSVEGWAFQGAHVDLLVTYRDTEDGVSKTRVAIENAVVLSVEGKTTRREDRENETRVSQGSTLTLAVPAQDTLKVRTAQAIGKISLVLRSSDDVKSIGQDPFGAGDFDQAKKKKDGNISAPPLGYASYTDKDGNEHEFTLGSDKRWFVSGDDKE